MRKTLYWLGWAVLLALPFVYATQVYLIQDLPRVEAWKWIVPCAAAVLIYLARNRDDVLKHHVV